jgi:predicted HNH restriction endonuclease
MIYCNKNHRMETTRYHRRHCIRIHTCPICGQDLHKLYGQALDAHIISHNLNGKVV